MNQIKETIEILNDEETILKYIHIKAQGNFEVEISPKFTNALSHAIEICQGVESAGKELPEKKEALRTDYLNGYRNGKRKGFNKMHDIATPILAKAKIKLTESERVTNDFFEQVEICKEDLKQAKLRIEEEKKIRIKYQDIVYKICLLFDTRYNKTLVGEVADKVKLRIEELEKQVDLLEEEDCISHCQEVAILKRELQSAKDKIKELEKYKSTCTYSLMDNYNQCQSRRVIGELKSELQSLKEKLTVENLKKIAYSRINLEYGGKEMAYNIAQALIKELEVLNEYQGND